MVISGIIIAFVFNFLFSNSLPALGSHLRHRVAQREHPRQPGLRVAGDRHRHGVAGDPRHAAHLHRRLLSIPGEVYEAADIDGASKTPAAHAHHAAARAGYVVINVILGFKGFLNAYDIIVGLTDGGPGTSTRSIAMTIVTGFTSGDYAYQMANATVFFVITILIALLQLSITRGRNAL